MDTLLKNTRDWLQTSTRRSFSAVLEEAKITPPYITNSPYQSIAANVAGACGCAYNAG